MGYKKLARQFEVSSATVQAILSGKSWAWLK
jgi:hypothetical protein